MLPLISVTIWRVVGYMLENPVYPTATAIRGRDNVVGAENQQERLWPMPVNCAFIADPMQLGNWSEGAEIEEISETKKR